MEFKNRIIVYLDSRGTIIDAPVFFFSFRENISFCLFYVSMKDWLVDIGAYKKLNDFINVREPIVERVSIILMPHPLIQPLMLL